MSKEKLKYPIVQFNWRDYQDINWAYRLYEPFSREESLALFESLLKTDVKHLFNVTVLLSWKKEDEFFRRDKDDL